MKRDSIFVIFIKGFGCMAFGNILGGILTVSLAPFLKEWYIPYIAVLFTLFIYGSLLFTAGWRDGQKEAKMLRSKRVESVPKYRWIFLGLALGAIMCLLCVYLVLCATKTVLLTGEFLLGSLFVFGGLAPAFYIIDVSDMSIVFPIVLMAIYITVTPACAQFGYRFGVDEKSFKDMMYE